MSDTLDLALSRSAPLSRDLVVDGPARLNGQRIERQVQLCSGGLADGGVGHGDVVAWQRPNGWESVILMRACWRLGAVAAPLPYRFGPDRAAVLAARIGADLVDPATLPRGSPVLSGTKHVEGTDRSVILFTSGSSSSSGEPKAVVHTHASLNRKARQLVELHGLDERDVVAMPADLAHISGVLHGVLVPGIVPFRSVLMERWEPGAAADAIEREGVTFMDGPPSFFWDLAATGRELPSLRLICVAGPRVTAEFCESVAARFGATVTRTYGSTEAPTVSAARREDPAERRWHFDGRAVPGVEMRIDDGGELLVRGPDLFSGYLDLDDAGRLTHATVNGWFHTGDVGELDDGWLRIIGRLGDVIVRNGENISPLDVEATLLEHDAVTGAIVAPVPDERLGQRVGALVVADGEFDLAECHRWFESQGVARSRWPEYLARATAIPRLESGAPDRRQATEFLSA